MDTILYPEVLDNQFKPGLKIEQRDFSCERSLLEYFFDELRVPQNSFKATTTYNFNKELANNSKVLTNPMDWFETTLYEDIDFKGRFATLSNLINNIEVEWKLSDNKLNDKVSSVKVGRAVACVVLFQHSYLRGHRLWLIGGQKPSKNDLTQIRFPDGGNWNDRISSALSATVSPAQVLKWITGVVF